MYLIKVHKRRRVNGHSHVGKDRMDLKEFIKAKDVR